MASTLDSESSERLGGTCKAFSLDTAGTPKQALNRLELDLLWTILHLAARRVMIFCQNINGHQ